MGEIEDILERKFLIVDSWDVKHQHMLIFGFSVLMAVTYGLFLWLICSLTPSLIATLFLLTSQITLGLPATRAYYDFGISARRMLRFYDSGVLGSETPTEDLKIRIGDMPLVFERMNIQLQKYDSGAFDDLNDLAWFAVIVWSMVSSLFFYQNFHAFPVCPFGAVVLTIACLASYIGGLRTIQGGSFEEYLNQLEFYIEKHIRYLDAIVPSLDGMVILQVIKRRRKYVPVDVILEFRITKNVIVEYHLGLASHRNERFILEASQAVINWAYSKFRESDTIQKSQWVLEQMKTQSGYILRLIDSQKAINFSDLKSTTMSLSFVEKSVQEAGIILKEIKHVLSELE